MKAEFPIWNPWLWPVLAATYAGEAALHTLNKSLTACPTEPVGPEPVWATPHVVRSELPSLRVREFSLNPGGVPTLLVAPFALHGAALADFAPGHSLVESLLSGGLDGLSVVECRSATPPMRFLSIDNYLADLTVVVQDLGGLVNLIGLCQGGWLSLIFAARFPHMICSVALAGAPIDLASPSNMVAATRATASDVFEGLVRSGDGLILGQRMLDLWGVVAPDPAAAAEILQVGQDALEDLFERYNGWHQWTVNLPGQFYLQVVEHLFRRNELARGEFRALGRQIDLSSVRAPLFLLAGEHDDITPPAQLLAVGRLVGTPARRIQTTVAQCGHLSLFMGKRTLQQEWRQIARDIRSLSQ